MLDNYPPGAANDPRAPYNEPGELDAVDVDVNVSYTVSKSTTISTNDYCPECWEDVEPDDEGGVSVDRGMNPNFSNTNFEEAFNNDSEVYGIPQLLDTLQFLVQEKITSLHELLACEALKDDKRKNLKELRKYESILESAKDWTVDDFSVSQE